MTSSKQNYKYYSNSRLSGNESKVFLETKMPLAGGFLRNDQEKSQDLLYPLTLSFCEESCCVQVNESINPNILFSKYSYKTGAINTLVSHLKGSANDIKKQINFSKILEVGCNDFTFLKNFINESKLIVGVDPSDISKNNVIPEINLINDFFCFEQSENIKAKYGLFDAIFSSNNFAHIEDIQDYSRGISNLLKDDGSFVCEVHWVGTIIDKMQFPFIYHEHLYYYTLKSLQFLLRKSGLYINDVQEIDIHGGSIRIFASKMEQEKSNVSMFLEKERSMGLYELNTYKEFSKKIESLKKKSKDFFNKVKKENKNVFGYGASGQANSLMSFFEISNDDLKFIIDDSPIKDGLITPRNHIKIKNRDFLIKNTPDYIYVLAYTFLNEIIDRNKSIKCEWISAI